MKLLFLLTLYTTLFQPVHSVGISSKKWHELGGIGFEDNNDLTGFSVATSKSGYTVAVGSPKHASLDPNPDPEVGLVRVYRYDLMMSQWNKIGQDIVGQSAGDQFGHSIALSDDGTLLAVGAPYCDRLGVKDLGCVKIYELVVTVDSDEDDMSTKTEVWFERGDTIVGEKAFDHFGTAINIQDSFDVINDRKSYKVAIGAPDNDEQNQDSGTVYLYNLSWKEEHAALDWALEKIITDNNPLPLAKFGSSVSMTSDSKMLAIGAPYHGNFKEGVVRLFHQDENGDWNQIDLPDDFDQHQSGENCGSSVSVDRSGVFIAIGCPGLNAGKVQFLKKETHLNGTISWDKSEIIGDDQGSLFGTSVMLSDVMNDHVIVAIGAPKNARLGENKEIIENTGHVRVFYKDDGNWIQAGFDVEGLEADDEFGSCVAISKDGHRIIAGAPPGGYAQTYTLEYTAPPTPGPTPSDTFIDLELVEWQEDESEVWIILVICAFAFVALMLGFVILISYDFQNAFEAVLSKEDCEVV